MSPAATLDAAEAEARALRSADDLFYNHGVGAVTMAEIRDHSAVSLRRLYAMYPSKADLVTAWLEHRHAEWMAGFAARVAERVDAGAEPIEAVFGALEAWMVETDFRGCGFINTYAEGSDLTDAHRAVIRDHKRAVAAYLAEVVPDGGRISVVIDGAIVQAAIFRTVEPIRSAGEVAMDATGRAARG